MSELKKTLAFVAVALVLSATAAFAVRPKVRTPEAFDDQGKPFFPAFKDPLACTQLEVIDYDPGTASALPFKVMLKDGKWVIPSHHDYPADAKDRLAKTAAGVIDLKRDVIVSDRPDQWEDLGVIDPIEPKASSLKGRGKRVTLRDKAGAVLADFIIGKDVPGRTGQRYVRVPEQKRTYAVNVNVDLSARFADWIETNLLKLDASRIRKITFDSHKVDPERRTIDRGDVVAISRKDAGAPWTTEGLAPDQEVDSAKTGTLTSALADLKIVGVRPKPAGLTAALKASTDGNGLSLNAESQRSLANRGFYLLRDGRLLSNQGDVIADTEDGIVYMLRFGEVSFATGEALSAGTQDEGSSPSDSAKKQPEKTSAESRYLLVMAEFDPSLIPPPKPPTPPTPATLPDKVFARMPDDPALAAQIKADRQADKLREDEHKRKVEEARKKAQELTERFAGWYYLVPGDAFRDVMLNRASLIKKKDAAAPASPGGLQGFPGLPGGRGGFPGGLNLPNGHP